MNQPQLVTNIPSQKRMGSSGIIMKVQDHNNFSNQKYFFNHLKFKGQHYFLKSHKFKVHKE